MTTTVREVPEDAKPLLDQMMEEIQTGIIAAARAGRGSPLLAIREVLVKYIGPVETDPQYHRATRVLMSMYPEADVLMAFGVPGKHGIAVQGRGELGGAWSLLEYMGKTLMHRTEQEAMLHGEAQGNG